MGLSAASINRSLADAASRTGYLLWRQTLTRSCQRYAEAAHTTTGCQWYYSVTLREGFAWARAVRSPIAPAGKLDRVMGTGWDRSRPPAFALPPSAPAATRDLDRLDLGHAHRAVAQWLGGSDAAVLATHIPFFLARMTRHVVVAAVTSVGFVPGCLVGACIVAPWELVKSGPRGGAAFSRARSTAVRC
jgi:hypothetical protein